jgi:hypothetical protein
MTWEMSKCNLVGDFVGFWRLLLLERVEETYKGKAQEAMFPELLEI